MNALTNFTARMVENGWIVTVDGSMGCLGTNYVFTTLDELADWLKVQVTPNTQKAS